MNVAAVELVLDARAELGERPRWGALRQRPLWVGIAKLFGHAA